MSEWGKGFLSGLGFSLALLGAASLLGLVFWIVVIGGLL